MPLSRHAETTSNTKHVNQRNLGTRVTLALGITILQAAVFWEKDADWKSHAGGPKCKIGWPKANPTHQQLVRNVVGSSSWVRNNTQQYLIAKGPRVICIWIKQPEALFQKLRHSKIVLKCTMSLELEQLICATVLPRAQGESDFSALHAAASERLRCACRS